MEAYDYSPRFPGRNGGWPYRGDRRPVLQNYSNRERPISVVSLVILDPGQPVGFIT